MMSDTVDRCYYSIEPADKKEDNAAQRWNGSGHAYQADVA